MLLAIDPGIAGAFVFFSELNLSMEYELMPLGPQNEINFEAVRTILGYRPVPQHVFLERAVSFGMGTKAAFNYGRGFAALEIAIRQSGLPVTYVEPSKWTKLVCEGVDANLKPKVRSAIAVERLLPWAIPKIPKSKTGKMHEGVVDALLIAEFGRRQLIKNA